MSEVERGDYERVIEEQERENSGLKEELIELKAHISQMKVLQRRMMELKENGSRGLNE
jgi:predicted RNase H-like nuclease (RuvC/YqgF family)